MRGMKIDKSDFMAFLAEPSSVQKFSPLNLASKASGQRQADVA
jgi:hypothetical protein